MSTRTDGAASPSVGGSDDADGEGAVGAPVSGPDATPPRPRGPEGPAPPPPGPTGHGRGSRSGSTGDSAWVQQEIQRRIAARGAGETARHSRSDRNRAAPGGDGTPADGPGEDVPPPRTVTGHTGPLRRRSTRVPDPYAAEGMRDQAEPPGGPFRMPGPAAASPEPHAPRSEAAAPATPPKQWPPAEGAASLPRRVPGAGWTLDRRVPGAAGATGAADDPEPETRIVPALWAAGSDGSRGNSVRNGVGNGVAAPAGSAVADEIDDEHDLHVELREDLHDGIDTEPDDLDADLDTDSDDDPDDDLAPTGLTGDTEVIWRAPGLDVPPVPAPVPPATDGAPAPNPHTGVRPRRFAAPTTDVEPDPESAADDRPECPDLDDAPHGKRKRVVLSERRTVAHSVRAVVDVQDPGPVGTMWRSQLVGTQLRISLQVGGVALLALFLMPALFAAFPSMGAISVFGVRLPWLLLGFLSYPFLLLLGWWFVGSAERAEQDFIREVQDR